MTKLKYYAQMPDREGEIKRKKKENPEVDQIPVPPGEEPPAPIQDPPSPAEREPIDEGPHGPKKIV
jgi:hypothetical protein